MSSAKYILWGTKRGNQVFNHSADIPESIIKTISRDIRGYININQPKVRFYSVEFVSNYKVITLYSSIYDWSSSPGFLAISALLEVNAVTAKDTIHSNVFNLLSQLYEVYANEYMDSSFRLTKDREDISKFENILAAYKLEAIRKLPWPESPNNTNLSVVYYESEKDLNLYLNDTLRKTYQAYQKVFFFGTEYKGKHSRLIDITSQVPPIEKEYTLEFNLRDTKGDKARDVSCEITLNNNDTYSSIFTLPKLKENDSVDYKFSSQNYEDSRGSFVVAPAGDTSTLSHTVTLFEKKYDVTITVVGSFDKAYKNKDKNTLTFNNRSYPVPDGEVVLKGLTLSDANTIITVKDSKGAYQDRTESLLAHEIKKREKEIKLRPIPTPTPRRKKEDVTSGGSTGNISSRGSTKDDTKYNEDAFGRKDSENKKYNPQKIALLATSVLFVLLAVYIGTSLLKSGSDDDKLDNTTTTNDNPTKEEKMAKEFEIFKISHQISDSLNWLKDTKVKGSIDSYTKSLKNITRKDSLYLNSMSSIIARNVLTNKADEATESAINEDKVKAQKQLDAIIKIANSGNVIDVKILNGKREEAKSLKKQFPKLDFSALEGNYIGLPGYQELDDRLVNWETFCSSQFGFKNNFSTVNSCKIINLKLYAKLSKAQNNKIKDWIDENLEIGSTYKSVQEYVSQNCPKK